MTYTAPPTVPSGGMVTVTAITSTPEVQESSLTLQIDNPIPVINSVSTVQITAGIPRVISVYGTGFVPATRAMFTGTSASSLLKTSFVVINANTATVEVTTGKTSYGQLSLQLSNPGPEGTISGSVNITVIAPPPPPQVAGPHIFNVSDYGASGSALSISCSGRSGDSSLSQCTGDLKDFTVGQGLMIQGGSRAPRTRAFTTPPVVRPQGTLANGSHRYCYIIFTVDPLDGVSAPSPQSCVANEPDLSYLTTWNSLNTDTSSVGPSPTFLWYVSVDDGDFNLVCAQAFNSGAMDVGQRPGTRGGWPTALPVANYDISKNEDLFTTVKQLTPNGLVIADPLQTTLQNATVLHDDTKAVQDTIDAAVATGGGIVQFGAGTFSIRRPSFIYIVNNSVAYPSYSTDPDLDPWWAQFSRLHIANGSTGHIHLQGVGVTTVLNTPPDHGANVTLLAVGNFQRPDRETTGRFQISDTSQGSTEVTVTASDGTLLSPGDDVWLFSGSFTGTPCSTTDGTPGGCHYSELNSVAAVSNNMITLANPTSKHFYDDGSSSFGMVKMRVTPHDIALEHMSIGTFEPNHVYWLGLWNARG